MENNQGYVYILTSPNTDCIKIGGSDYPPMKRIREINNTEPYKSFGPWSLVDFRQVKNWRNIEHQLHYMFREKAVTSIDQQKELFKTSVFEVTTKLNEIDPELILYKPKIDRMFQDESFLSYITKLFSFTGLLNWLDIQGAWTFVLFPATSGGRYFTINIGPHEVAYSTLGRNNENQTNMLLVDKLIMDYRPVRKWINEHNGHIGFDMYKSALPRATSLTFEGSFDVALELFQLDGVRRAIIAYWVESLIQLKENNNMSLFSKYHNWNAVAKIHNYLDNIG